MRSLVLLLLGAAGGIAALFFVLGPQQLEPETPVLGPTAVSLAGEPGAEGPLPVLPRPEPAGEPSADGPGPVERRGLGAAPRSGELGPALSLQLFDARTRAPIEGVRASIIEMGPSGSRASTAGSEAPASNDTAPPLAEATSDGQGRASLAWPEWEGEPALRLGHPDYVDLVRGAVEAGGELKVGLVPSGSIRGEVLGVVDGARILLWQRELGREDEEPDHEVPLADGRFVFEDLSPGEYTLALLGEGLPLELRSGIFLEPAESLFLSLGPLEATTLDVLVGYRGATIRPLEGASVRCVPRREGVGEALEGLAERRATSGEDGRVTFEGLGAGPCRVEVVTPWGATLYREKDPSSLAWGGEELRFLFPTPGRITGLVQWPDGKAAAGARVLLFEGFKKRQRIDPGADGAGLCEAVTGEDGSFELEPVPSTVPLMLLALPPGQTGPPSFAWRSPRNVPPDTLRSDFNITLCDTGSIAGQLVDIDGEPLVGIEVGFEIPISGGYSEWRSLVTDGSGRVLAEGAPAARVRAYVSSPEVSAMSEGFDVVPGERVEFTWVVERRHSIDCLVVDEEGFALPGVRVVADGVKAGDRQRRRSSSLTDEFGRATIEGLEAGAWVLDCSRRGLVPADPPQQVELPAGELAAVLRMRHQPRPEPATVTGEVMRMGDGAPIPELQVIGLQGGVLKVSGTTFEVTGVRPGPKRIVVRAPGYTLHAYSRQDLLPGATLRLETVQLRPAGRVEVSLVDEEGRLVKASSVVLERPGAVTFRLGSESKGRFVNEHVRRGEYTLVVRRGKQEWKRPFSVDSREVRRRIVLR